jgi:hypothetical protein
MKRIALIVCSGVLFVAGSGAASARSILLPYPPQLVSKTQRLAPDSAYLLLNPTSKKQDTRRPAGERKRTTVTCKTVLGCIDGVYWQP